MGGLETLGVSLTTFDLDCFKKQILNIAFVEKSMRTERINWWKETWREKILPCFLFTLPGKTYNFNHGVDNVRLYTDMCFNFVVGGERSQYSGLIFLCFLYLFMKHCTSMTFAFNMLTCIFTDISHCVGPMSYKILHSKCDGFLRR